MVSFGEEKPQAKQASPVVNKNSDQRNHFFYTGIDPVSNF